MKKFLILGIIFLFLNALVVKAASPHLEFSPASGTISTGGTNININIDTGGEAAKSAKAVVNFDPAKLEVVSVTPGNFFDEVSYNIYNNTGQVIVNANLSLGSSLETKTGTGTLATVNIKAKQSSGNATLTFDCTEGSSIDSGINDPTPVDIIDCSANVNGSYSLGTGVGGATSVSPSPSASSLAVSRGIGGGGQSSPSALPVAGNSIPTISIFLIGLSLVLISVPLLLMI